MECVSRINKTLIYVFGREEGWESWFQRGGTMGGPTPHAFISFQFPLRTSKFICMSFIKTDMSTNVET